MLSRLPSIRSRERMIIRGWRMLKSSNHPEKSAPPAMPGAPKSTKRSLRSDARIPVEHPPLVEEVTRAVEGQDEVTGHGVGDGVLDGAQRLRTIGTQQLPEHRRVTLGHTLSPGVDHTLIVVGSRGWITGDPDVTSRHEQDTV